MRYDRNVVVAYDFDNTVTTGSVYGKTGAIDKRAVRWIRRITLLGPVMVLWTTREGGDLEEALDMLARHGLSPDHVNGYDGRGDSRKLNADVYIDDKANDGRIRWFRTYIRVWRLISGRCR